MAKDNDTPKDSAAQEQEPVPPQPSPYDLVPIRLFKDNGKYKDDVFVAVNGRTFQIKRGMTVMVPRYVAKVLEQSQYQDEQTAQMLSELEAEFLQKSKKYETA